MRILYHHRTQGEEPESIHILAIVNALRSLGHEVELVGPSGAREQALQSGRRSLLGRVKALMPRAVFEVLQLGYNAIVFVELWRAVSRIRPDFVYERYALYSFAGVALARWRRIPLMLEVNTPYAQEWARYYGLRFAQLARWIERRILLSASHIVTVTHVQKRMLTEQGIPAESISVCHNAIAPDEFDSTRCPVAQLRRELGLREIVVGFVGTMNRWQGMDRFPDVVRAVLDAREDVSFLFVGDGEFRSPLEYRCRDQGFADRVVFVGRRPHREISALVAAMDIAVLMSSNAYGSPMKIFEYWAMGKAVIAPSVEPVREVLRDGETGLLIPPGDAGAMTARILELAGNAELRSRLGRAGRAYVVANHTWNGNATAIVHAYERLETASKRGPSPFGTGEHGPV